MGSTVNEILSTFIGCVDDKALMNDSWMEKRKSASQAIVHAIDAENDDDDDDDEDNSGLRSYASMLPEHLLLHLNYISFPRVGCFCPCSTINPINKRWENEMNNNKCKASFQSQESYINHIQSKRTTCQYHEVCLQFLIIIYEEKMRKVRALKDYMKKFKDYMKKFKGKGLKRKRSGDNCNRTGNNDSSLQLKKSRVGEDTITDDIVKLSPNNILVLSMNQWGVDDDFKTLSACVFEKMLEGKQTGDDLEEAIALLLSKINSFNLSYSQICDQMRIALLEYMCDVNVCSVSQSHSTPTSPKHLNMNFCTRKTVGEMKEQFKGYIPFHQITMDYFWNQSLWTANAYGDDLFQWVMPGLVKEEIIYITRKYEDDGGDILLPFTTYFLGQVIRFLDDICGKYIISFLYNMEEIPLLKCTNKFDSPIFENFIPGRNINQQQIYVGVSAKAIRQNYLDSGLEWQMFQEFMAQVKGSDHIMYIRFKALKNNLKCKKVQKRKMFTGYLIDDVKENFEKGLGGIYLGNYKEGSLLSKDSHVNQDVLHNTSGRFREHRSRQVVKRRFGDIAKHWKNIQDPKDPQNVVKYHNYADKISDSMEINEANYDEEAKCDILYPIGLMNDHNSCYANICLQLLNSIPTFTQIFHSNSVSEECKTSEEGDEITQRFNSMLQVMDEMKLSKHCNIGISQFNTEMGYNDSTQGFDSDNNNVQQDFNEFFMAMLETDSDGCNGGPQIFLSPENKIKILAIFGCRVRQIITCHECQNFTQKDETMDLSEFYLQWDHIENGVKNPSQTVPARLFPELFTSLFKGEYHDEESGLYDCDKCNNKTPWTRQIFWMKAPNILFVGLKRNYYDPEKKGNIRIDHAISPPKRLRYCLDLSNTNACVYTDAVKEASYTLCALVLHSTDDSSNALSKGHYYIDVMDWYSGCWFRCNNEDIEPRKAAWNEQDKRNILFLVYVRDVYMKTWGIESIYQDFKRKNDQDAGSNIHADNGEHSDDNVIVIE